MSDGPTSAMSFSQALSLAAHEGAWIRRSLWFEHNWVGIARPEMFGAKAVPDGNGHNEAHWNVKSMSPIMRGFTYERPDIGDSGMLFYMGTQYDNERTDGGINRTTRIVFGWTPIADDMLAQDWTVYTP